MKGEDDDSVFFFSLAVGSSEAASGCPVNSLSFSAQSAKNRTTRTSSLDGLCIDV